MPTSVLTAQFYTVDFVADQASLITADCGLLNPVYNTCFGISAGVENIIDIQSGSMLFIDVEGNGCTAGCSGGEAGGDNQNFYETGNIDVSGQSAFNITANFAFWNYADFGVGGNAANCGAIPASLETNPGCGQDMLSFRYSIDGGPWELFNPAITNAANVGTGGGLQVSTSGCSLSGTNVRIQVQFGTQSVAEGILIESIEFFSASGGSSAVASVSQSPVCVGENVVFSETGGIATMWQWSNPSAGNAGSTSMINVNNVQLADAGTWTVTITDASGCTGTDDVNLMVHPLPIAHANIDITLCDAGGGTANFDLTSVNTSISGGSGTVNWFSDPAGTIAIANETNFNASNGTSVYATVDDGMCESEPVEVTLLVNAGPTANAGGPYNICEGAVANIIGSIGGQATSGTWSTSGDGSFGNPNALSTTYSPGPTDISSGTVTISLTTDDVGGTCMAGVDMVNITISQAPIANTGGPYSVCQGSNVSLNGSLGGAATIGSWVTLGDGTFNNPALPNAIYTPGIGDIGLGTVTLSFTASTNGGNCPPDTEMVNVTITPAPAIMITSSPSDICGNDAFQLSAQLGGSASSLTWSSSGDGLFSNPNGTTTFYTPGPFDMASGSITITVSSDDVGGSCTAATDDTFINISNPPAVSIDPISDICEGSTINANAILGGSATSVMWSSSGDGVFNNPNLTNTVYSPGPFDINFGSVTLTATTDDVNGSCTAAVENVMVNIIESPTVSIDPVSAACAGGTIDLSAVIGGLASSVTWSSFGDGTFTNTGSLATSYMPGPGDISFGSVNILITTDDVNGLCSQATDNVVVNLNTGPTIMVPQPDDICDSENIALNGIIGGTATGISWSTTGDGVFNNPTILSPTYTAGSTDISNGTVTLEATTISAGGCPEVIASVTVQIFQSITLSVSGNSTACGNEIINLTATSNQSTVISWTSSGDGTFSNNTGLNTAYTIGAADILAGSVTLSATTADPSGPCTALTTTHDIIISEVVSAGISNPTVAYCNSDNININLFGELVGASAGGVWTEISTTPSSGIAFNAGAGTFNIENQAAGLYEFEYSIIGNPPCPSDTEIVRVEVLSPPSATVTGTAVTCNLSSQGSVINFDILITAGDASGNWSDTDATGVDLTNTGSVNFDGIAPGIYTFTYMTNSAVAPCLEGTYTTVVTVEDCACPSVATSPIPDQCVDNANVDLGTFVTTSEMGSWTIIAAPPGSNPATLNGSDFQGTGSDVGSYTLSFTLDAAPIANCPDSSVQTINIFNTSNAGSAQPTLEICTPSNNNIVDLFGLLNDENIGGTWIETSSTPSSGSSFNAGSGTFDITGQQEGLYSFLYSINGIAPCPNDSEEVFVQLFSAPTATVTSSGQICNSSSNGSIFNFDALITAGDMGGSWTDTDGAGIDLTNTNAVDFDGIVAGNYVFTYRTNSAAGPCVENEYTITIAVEDCACPSVATSPIADLCENNADIDLAAYTITSEAGSWFITTAPAGPNPATIIGTNFNGSGTNLGSYLLTFTLANPVQGCPENSTQTVNILSSPEAGNAAPPFELCSPEIVSLFDLLSDEDLGGSWTEVSSSPSTSGAFDDMGTFDTDLQNAGTYLFQYTVDGISPCGSDSEIVEVVILQTPFAVVNTQGQICNSSVEGSIFNFDAQVTGGDLTGSWTDMTGAGVDLTNTNAVDFDGISEGNYSFEYTTNSATGSCSENVYSLTISVENCSCPSVLTGALPDLCASNGVLDLSGFAITSEPGSWSLSGTPAGSNSGSVTGNFFNGTNSDPGEYTLVFTLDAAPIPNCPDSSVQTLNLFAVPDAGIASFSFAGCNTDPIPADLTDFVFGADVGGNWTETSATLSTGGAFDPVSATFSLLDQLPGIYSFTYSVSSNGPCPTSSTEYTVVVEDGATAEVSPQAVICNSTSDGSLLNLNNYILSGTNTGTWTDTDGSGVDLTNLAAVDFNGVTPDSYTFTYTLAGTQFCSEQNYTTTIEVQDCACPNVLTQMVPDFCENDPNIDLFDYNFPGQIGAWSLTNSAAGSTPPTLSGTILNIQSGDPGIYELTFTLAGGPFAGCPDSSVINFSILGNSAFDFNANICTDDSVVINGNVYNAGTTSGIETIVGGAANGCDSIINVNLTISNAIQLPTIDTMLCLGDELLINGTVFNQNNTSGNVIFNQAGCDSTQMVTINFFPPSEENYSTTLCTGETININGTTFSESYPSGPVLYPGGSINGCDSTVNVTVIFDNNISAGISSIPNLCLGDSLALNFEFSTSGIFDVSYLANGNTFSLSGISDGHVEMIYLDNSSDIILDYAQAIAASCTVEIPLAPLSINVYDVEPSVTILTNFNGYEVSCAGSADAEAMIDMTGGIAPYTVDWNGTIPDLNNLGAGTYFATISDFNGCVDSIDFQIHEPAATMVDLTINDNSCPGDLTGSIIINEIVGTGSTYSYSFNNTDFAQITALPFQIQGLASGAMDLYIVDENECGVVESADINSGGNLLIDVSPDRIIQLGESIELSVSSNFTIDQIIWSPGNTLSCIDCPNPIARPLETTIYRVQLLDIGGCEVEADIELRVEKPNVFVPNVFSPNNDGVNDLFFVQSRNENLIIEQFIIADRWGEIVFQGKDIVPNNPSNGWNGELRNRALNPGVYVYYIEMKYPDGKVVSMKGDVTLMR